MSTIHKGSADFAALIDRVDADGICAVVDAEFVARLPGHRESLSVDAFIATTRGAAARFSHRSHTLEWSVVDGGRAVSAVTFRATDPASGRDVAIPGLWIHEWSSAGRLRLHEVRYDRAALTEALEPPPSMMNTAMRSLAALEGVAALAGRAQLAVDATAGDPLITPRLDAVCAALGLSPQDIARAPMDEQRALVGMVQSFLRQALDVVERPARAAGWTTEDPVVLQAQGRASLPFSKILEAAAPLLPGLTDLLSAEGAALLDVGTGVGWLSIACARAFPALHAVGIDVWKAALAIADNNVRDSGLSARVSLRHQDVREVDDDGRFAIAWLPGPFLPREIVPAAVAVTRRALKPGGWLFFGLYDGPPGPLADAVVNLRIVRSGGHPWQRDEVAKLLEDGGLRDVRVLPRLAPGPIGVVVGRK